MQLLDVKFSRLKRQYVLQCLLATVCVLAVLIILDGMSQAAIIASLGATAFIVFALPKTDASRPRVVIPGYLIGAIAGTACHWLAEIDMTGHPPTERYLTIALAAFAIGLTIFLMTVTNTEHAPAAGVALGLVIQRWSLRTLAVVMVGVIVLCVTKWLLRRWLRDLA